MKFDGLLGRVLAEGAAEERVVFLQKRYPDTDSQLLKAVVDIDPSPSKAYSQWIMRQLVSRDIQLPEDEEKLTTALTELDDAKRRGLLKGPDADIMRYKQLGDLRVKLDALSGRQTAGERHRRELSSGASEVMDDPPWRVVRITTVQAASDLCRNTQWCVKDPFFARRYLDHAPLYLIYRQDQPYALVHEADGEIRDPQDRQLSAERESEVMPIVDRLPLGKLSGRLAAFRQHLPMRTPHEAAATGSPQMALEYARRFKRRVPPEVEEVIARSPYAANRYADRWWFSDKSTRSLDIPQGLRRALIEVPNYAWSLIKYEDQAGREKPDGDALRSAMRSPSIVNDIARKFGGNQELETAVLAADDMQEAVSYAMAHRRSRWPELEKRLLRSLGKGRMFDKDSNIREALRYTAYVIQGPWPELLDALIGMQADASNLVNYAEQTKDNDPRIAQAVLKQAEGDGYFENCQRLAVLSKRRWPEYEELLLKLLATYKPGVVRERDMQLLGQAAARYAEYVIQGRWPEFEDKAGPEIMTSYARNMHLSLDVPGEAGILAKAEPKEILDRYLYGRQGGKPMPPEVERLLLKDPHVVYSYMASPRTKREDWAEGLAVLAKHPKLALSWAKRTGKRFEAAEEEIAKDPKLAVEYVNSILKRRWREVEERIAKRGEEAAQYAIATGQPFPAGEKQIAKNAKGAFDYATRVLKQRWKPGERAIAGNPSLGLRYAIIFSFEWPEAEAKFLAVPEKQRSQHWYDNAAEYAAHGRKSRWPEYEGEMKWYRYSYTTALRRAGIQPPPEPKDEFTSLPPAPKTPAEENRLLNYDESAAKHHALYVRDKRWPEFEQKAMEWLSSATGYHRESLSGYLGRYAAKFMDGDWPEAAEWLVKNGVAGDMLQYVKGLARRLPADIEKQFVERATGNELNDYRKLLDIGRWPEAEARILTSPKARQEYQRDILKAERYKEKRIRLSLDSLDAAILRDVLQDASHDKQTPSAVKRVYKELEDATSGEPKTIHVTGLVLGQLLQVLDSYLQDTQFMNSFFRRQEDREEFKAAVKRLREAA